MFTFLIVWVLSMLLMVVSNVQQKNKRWEAALYLTVTAVVAAAVAAVLSDGLLVNASVPKTALSILFTLALFFVAMSLDAKDYHPKSAYSFFSKVFYFLNVYVAVMVFFYHR